CLPHAGGSAALCQDWFRESLPGVQVVGLDPPGRGARFGERPLTRAREIVSDLAQRLLAEATEPFALFGHSVGAMIAYELTLALQRRGLAPAALFVSAHRAPHLAFDTEPLHALPDQEFLERLECLGGIPAAVLADPELLALLLPVVRADLIAWETYRYVPSGPVMCRIVAVGGSADQLVRPDDLAEWRHHTTGPFRCRLFPSGHFYMNECRRGLAALIADELEEHTYRERYAT
ncbi:MAG: thioesterase II family protein, partial [Pseudonocardiaceae bacterium]